MLKPDELLGPEIEVDPITKRKCRDCGKYLHTSRYFKCLPCVNAVETIDEDFAYLGSDNRFLDDLEIEDKWGEWNSEDLL